MADRRESLLQDQTMCLILFALHSHPEYPLILAANREERHSRATASMAPWPDAPDILAGRDLEAGGTWLGLHRAGRFAAITNMREGVPTTAGLRSRGALTRDFLEQKTGNSISAAEYSRRVYAEREHYAGFNLLIGDDSGLWYCASSAAPQSVPQSAPQLLTPGIYGLSNGVLDTPWPKVKKGKAALQAVLAKSAETSPTPTDLLAILSDRSQPLDHELPDTGIGIEHERTLGTCFISGGDYGTRASTALLIDRSGAATIAEQSFGANGVAGALNSYRWPLTAIPC
jgi:uncharacterized protein with NRDE domain